MASVTESLPCRVVCSAAHVEVFGGGPKNHGDCVSGQQVSNCWAEVALYTPAGGMRRSTRDLHGSQGSGKSLVRWVRGTKDEMDPEACGGQYGSTCLNEGTSKYEYFAIVRNKKRSPRREGDDIGGCVCV